MYDHYVGIRISCKFIFTTSNKDFCMFKFQKRTDFMLHVDKKKEKKKGNIQNVEVTCKVKTVRVLWQNTLR